MGVLIPSFQKNFAVFFEGKKDAYEFLDSVDQVIHIEVKKLYPDAVLPKFKCKRTEKDFIMVYESKQAFADLAEGLISACIEDFQTEVDLIREDQNTEELNKTVFTLRAK